MSNSKTLNARFQLKYDSYQNWKDKNPTLLAGELAIAKLVDDVTIPVNEQKSAPVLFKVGPGAFNDLPWASGLAADVYSWAKQTEEDFIEWMNEKVVHPADTDLDTRYSFEIKDGKLVVNATTHTLGVAGTPAKVAELELATDAEIAAALENYYTKTEIDALLKEIRDSIAAIDTGVMSVTGKDAIVATGDDAVEVTLKIAAGEGKVGNVTLTQNEDGLKAEYDLAPELADFGISKDETGLIVSINASEVSTATLSVTGAATVQGEAIATQKYVGEQIEAAVEDLAVKNVSDESAWKQFVSAISLDADGNVTATHRTIAGEDIADALGEFGVTTRIDEHGQNAVDVIVSKVTAGGYVETTDVIAHGDLTVGGNAKFSNSVKKIEAADGTTNFYEVATERFATAAATTAQTAAEATAAADATAKANTAEANAKAYVDSEDIFETDMNTINALGGIGADVNLNGLTTHEVLKKLLYPYVDASVGNATASPNNGGTFEKGSTKTISSVSITVTKKSEPITSVALYDGSTEIETKTDVASGGTITFSNVNKSVTANGGKLTVKVTYPDAAGVAKTVSKETGAFTFISPYWYGVCGAADDIDAELVLGLTKDLTAKGTKTYSYTTEAQRMVIAYPSSYGKIKLVKDGNGLDNTGAFGQPVTVNVTSALGVTEEYYVYANGVTSGSAKMTFSY